MGDDIDIARLLTIVIAALAFILNVGTFIYNRFVEARKQAGEFADLEAKVDALHKDFELFVTQTIPDIKAERNRQINELHSEYVRRFTSIEGVVSRVPGMETKVELFWEFVRSEFPKLLVHHGEPMRDELLMKLQNNTIRHREGIDLKAMLENEYEHLEDKKSTEALYNIMTRLVLEATLKEGRPE